MVLRFLSAASAWLAKWTPAVVTAAAVAAYFKPELFGWVRGNAQTSVLGVIMLTMGMTLKSEDFKILASRPLDIAIGSLAQYTLMPLIAWTLVHALGLPKAVGIGLVLVGCCPGGVSSNIMTFLCKGDEAFSVGMTTLSTLVAPVATPVLMLWLAGESVDVDAVGMFMAMLLVTIVPIAVGFSLNAAFGGSRCYDEALKVMPGVAVAGLCCIVGGVVSAHGAVMAKTGAAIFAAVFSAQRHRLCARIRGRRSDALQPSETPHHIHRGRDAERRTCDGSRRTSLPGDAGSCPGFRSVVRVALYLRCAPCGTFQRSRFASRQAARREKLARVRGTCAVVSFFGIITAG